MFKGIPLQNTFQDSQHIGLLSKEHEQNSLMFHSSLPIIKPAWISPRKKGKKRKRKNSKNTSVKGGPVHEASAKWSLKTVDVQSLVLVSGEVISRI